MIYCREGFFFPIYGLLLLVFVRSYVNGRMEILKLDKENTTEREPVSMSAHLSTNAPDFAVNASFHSPHSESSSFTHVHGTLHEIPLPDAQVQLLSFIRNVQIVKSSQKSRKKRGFSAMPDEEIPGLENIVDEVEESAAVKKKPRKTFGKQGVKKDADGGKEKGASAATTTTAAPEKKAPEASAKKNGRGTATPSSAPPTAKGGNETDKDKAPKAQANSAAAKPSAAASSTSEKGSNDGPDAKPPTSVKDKAPAAQVPQGPPMPPPGAIPAPAPQIPQIQPSSPAEAARPSGMVSGGKIPNYKLIYFDARGICEPIRLLFHYAKVPFDDVRISRKQWLALKDSTVYGKVPILEVDGKPLTYCHTIARYLARQFGLAGVDSWEQAKVDEISDFHADVAMDLQPYMYVVAGFHQGDKHTLRQAIFLPNVEKHFPVYVNLLKLSGSGFFMPSGITWVDFVIAEYMTTVRHFEPQILDKYPAITKFVRKVQTQPQIFEYVTNREHQPVRK